MAEIVMYQLQLDMEAEEERNRLGLQRRQLRDALDPFQMPEDQFRMYFRLSPEVAHTLCDMLRDSLQHRHPSALSVEIQVCFLLYC